VCVVVGHLGVKKPPTPTYVGVPRCKCDVTVVLLDARSGTLLGVGPDLLCLTVFVFSYFLAICQLRFRVDYAGF